jgi:hypothetical protein
VGDASIACVRGGARVELPVVIAPIAISAPEAPFALDAPVAIDIALSPAPPPGEIVASAEAGFVVERVERTASGARVHVTPRRLGAGTLTLTLVTTAGTVELGRAAIAASAPDAPPPIAKLAELPPPRVWLGLLGGTAIDGPAKVAIAGNVEVGVIPLVAVEVGAMYADERGTGELGLALRHRVGRVTPMLRAGAVLDLELDRQPGIHAGLGVRVELGGRFAGYGRVGTTIVGSDVSIDALVGVAIGLGR